MNNLRIYKIAMPPLLALSLLFVACSPKHENRSGDNSNLAGTFSCEPGLDEMTVFSRTYGPFLQNNCAGCHSGTGPGPGAFANSGLLVAWNSFSPLGFSTINTKALDGHSSASGPFNKTAIDGLTEGYVNGLQAIEDCKSQGIGGGLDENQDGPTRVRTVSKAIKPDLAGKKVTVSWDLKTELVPNAIVAPNDMGDARLSIDVEVFERPGLVAWVVSRPRLQTTANDIHINSLLVKINNRAAKAQRAFYLKDASIRAWNASHPYFADSSKREANDLISDGALVVTGEVRTTDVLSISIGKVEKVVLPPLDLGPKVSFMTTTASINEGDTTDITLQLDKPWNEATSVEVEMGPETTVRDECCVQITNDMGNQIEPKNFDRDIETVQGTRGNYTVGGATGRWFVQFNSGETQKTIRVKTLNDTRLEGNEILHLRLANLSKLQPGLTNQEYRLTVVDDDAPYTGTARTYSQLMNPGGTLFVQCLRCHNSVDFRGGYDMTDHAQMIRKGILIPGDVNSIMYLRMNAILPGLDPMPLTGLLSSPLRLQVEGWISAGAQNN